MIVTINELNKLRLDQLKALSLKMGFSKRRDGDAAAVQNATAEMHKECILDDDWCFDYDSNRNPKFVHRDTGAQIWEPASYKCSEASAKDSVAVSDEVWNEVVAMPPRKRRKRRKSVTVGEGQPGSGGFESSEGSPTVEDSGSGDPVSTETYPAPDGPVITDPAPDFGEAVEGAVEEAVEAAEGKASDELEDAAEAAKKALDEMLKIAGKPSMTEEQIKDLATRVAEKVAKDVAKDEIEDYVEKPTVISIDTKEPRKIDGLIHKAYEEVLRCVLTQRPTYMVGPSGSGKSELAAQIAQAIEIRLASLCCSATTDEVHFVGRPLLHNGDFAPSPILSGYEAGNYLLFLDELDRVLGAVTTTINTALANGVFPVPLRHDNPMATRGDNVYWLAAGNTDMSGISDRFSADKQDGALRNRFRTQMVVVDYDKKLERAIAKGQGFPQVADIVDKAREAIASCRIDDEMGTRQVVDLCRFALNGADDKTLCHRILAPYQPEEVDKVKPFLTEWLG